MKVEDCRSSCQLASSTYLISFELLYLLVVKARFIKGNSISIVPKVAVHSSLQESRRFSGGLGVEDLGKRNI